MQIDLKWLLSILGMVCGYLAKWAFEKISSHSENKISTLEQRLEKNTESHNELKLAIVELKVEVKNLTEKLAPIPKMQQDIAHLHGLRRELEVRADKKNG